jgi:predicted O-linked N-acetylglucosamine transferase (SPINDLY family)
MMSRQASARPASIDQLLETATRCHRAGDLAAARGLYRAILDGAPDHALTLFRCGLLDLQEARAPQALRLLARAVARAPGEPRYRIGLGQALQALGRFAPAARAYRRAIEADPLCGDAHFALGLALQAQGEHAQAIGAYQRAVQIDPGHFAALNNLGLCRQRCGLTAQAAEAYARALEVRPDQAGTMANLGTALQALERTDEAAALLRAAVQLEPAVVSHAVNLGMVLCRRREFAAAEAVLRDAATRDAGNADALFNLGNALHGLGRSAEAAQAYRRAIALQPTHADACINLGNVLRELAEPAAAAAAYQAALCARPDSVIAMNNAACLLRSMGRFDEAEDMLRRALALEPSRAALHDNLGSVLKDAGDIDAAIACFRRALEIDPAYAATHSNLAYALCFAASTHQPILEECLAFGRQFADAMRCGAPIHANDRTSDRRLRIGYVSPDFREHCQSLFTIPVFGAHDHSAFEIFCYASVVRPDETTRRIAALADVWRDVRPLDDAALAARIQDDRIDVLVDLTMHMAGGRPLLFARKPAPVQVAWLAYPGTTGIAAMDYRLSDPRLDPAGHDAHYSERTLRLPDSFWCYDPLSTEPQVNSLPALERGFLTFGCLNNPCKLTDDTLQLWGAVLRALPESRLVLLAPSGRHRERLASRLEAQGIAASRTDFVPYRERAQYLRTYHDIDLGLDTVPYNGHTTSLDSLWMGVPTLTMIGRTCAGRAGLSQLHQLGLGSMAAATARDFTLNALAMSRDLPSLARLRAQLRARMQRSALMDAGRFTRNLEAAYRSMWTLHCASRGAHLLP